jgi:micrococcal nuclease
MKKGSYFTVFLLLTNLFVQGQQEIKIEDLNKHIDDSVTVCTKIYGGIFLERSSAALTLLNAGDMYPRSPLTLVIHPDARKNFKTAPEVFYKDKEVCITGKVILYKNKPEMVVYDEKQIVIQKLKSE